MVLSSTYNEIDSIIEHEKETAEKSDPAAVKTEKVNFSSANKDKNQGFVCSLGCKTCGLE